MSLDSSNEPAPPVITEAPHVIQGAPPATKTEARRVLPGCLLSFAIVVLLVVAAYFYMRGPHFKGSTVSSIAITMRAPEDSSKVVLQTSITNGPSCAAVLALLRSARFRIDHKCADIGTFAIRYSNGKADTLRFLPGHDPTSYEFRNGAWLYRLPREKFYKALRDAGVDTTKMPESEH